MNKYDNYFKIRKKFLKILINLLSIFILNTFLISDLYAISINFESEPLTKVAHFFSKQLNINLILDQKIINKKITANLNNIDPFEALNLILKVNGLELKHELDNIYIIFPREKLEFYSNESYFTIRIKNTNGEKICEILKNTFSKINFSFDKTSNLIIISGGIDQKLFNEIKQLVNKLDVKLPKIKLEYKVIKVLNLKNQISKINWNIISDTNSNLITKRVNIENIFTNTKTLINANLLITPSDSLNKIESTFTKPYVISENTKENNIVWLQNQNYFSAHVVNYSDDLTVLEIKIQICDIDDKNNGMFCKVYSGVVEIKNNETIVLTSLNNNSITKLNTFNTNFNNETIENKINKLNVVTSTNLLDTLDDIIIFLHANFIK